MMKATASGMESLLGKAKWKEMTVRKSQQMTRIRS